VRGQRFLLLRLDRYDNVSHTRRHPNPLNYHPWDDSWESLRLATLSPDLSGNNLCIPGTKQVVLYKKRQPTPAW